MTIEWSTRRWSCSVRRASAADTTFIELEDFSCPGTSDWPRTRTDQRRGNTVDWRERRGNVLCFEHD